MFIRPATKDDAAQILGIYAPYVQNTAISFEDTPPSLDDMQRRIETNGAAYGYFVVEQDGQIMGYAYGSQYAVRHAYRFTAEVSVYIDPVHRGKGLGRQLYDRLIPHMISAGYHTLVAIVALPNAGSAKLHQSCGFKRTGTLPEVGYKFNQWHDVGIWTREYASPPGL
ncbi:MAG: N-acetyltransferase family protein [Pseudomonadota bacterium]